MALWPGMLQECFRERVVHAVRAALKSAKRREEGRAPRNSTGVRAGAVHFSRSSGPTQGLFTHAFSSVELAHIGIVNHQH